LTHSLGRLNRLRISAPLVLVALALAPSAAAQEPSIVGGGTAAAAGWRFTVPLKERKLGFICTASVISPTSVITAAHCAKQSKPRDLRILEDSPWISGRRAGRPIKVTRIRIHPRYNGQKDSRDVAVLRLRRPTTTPAIALATHREARRAALPGSRVRSAGWGARSAWGFRTAKRLKTTRERVLTAARCRRYYGKFGYIPAEMICALGRPVKRFRGPHNFRSTSCSGDSGGPLVAATPAGPRLIGVVSAGPIPCGAGPSIYTRLDSVRRFIRRAMGPAPAG
jgi:secreted trypsin-like serine protease